MSLLDTIIVGKKLPTSYDYKEDVEEIEFLRLSYESNGVEYTKGEALNGEKIIPKNECEEVNEWEARCEKTPCRSYVSSIVNKYNASVFRNDPTRTTSHATYDLLLADADNFGNSLNSVMTKALKTAQIEGCAYLLADSTAAETEILTVAQSRSSGVRPFIRSLKREHIVNIEEQEEKILSAILLFEDDAGNKFARYMDDYSFVDISINDKLVVQSIGEVYSNGYDQIPLVEIKPLDDAQALPISYSQRSITNLLSILTQELTDSVFTKFILSGVRIPETGQTQDKVSWSGKRLIVLEDSGAKLDFVGADHAASDNLRSQIKIEEDNLYRTSGLGNPNVEPTNLSGYALKIISESFFTVCSALSKATEKAENKILGLISAKEGIDYIPVVYSTRFVADDSGEHLGLLRDLLALPLPQTFKNLAIKNYISMFYNLDAEQTKAIEDELTSNLSNTIN